VADREVDILIVGGGLAGATLMLALADLGYSTLLVEAKPFASRVQADFDARTLALAPASVCILQMLQIWPLLQEYATAIEMIHVSERHCFGSARLQSKESEPLGYVVEMQYINRALHRLLDPQQIIAPAELSAINDIDSSAVVITSTGELTVKARLIVAADGADSFVRQLCNLPTQVKEYGQHALVANIGLARAHQHHAYERFTSTGPLALLPMTGLRASLVWSLQPAQAARLLECSESDFLQALQHAFGYRLGRFVKVGQRTLYPLRQIIMPQQVKNSVVFVGNAAHTLHPVAGQGFNLGLRDVATLAQCIAREGLGPDMLQTYQQARSHDQAAITRFTDGLIELFTSRAPGLAVMRGAGLIALDNISILKHVVARYARGFAGVTPDLVCKIPLRNIHEPVF
jgi:2-octaprenyl-6-methoxyphenol hydroxylase